MNRSTKRIVALFALLLMSARSWAVGVPCSTQPADGPIRLLAIGNSFSANATSNLKAMTSAGGKTWVFGHAYIAGSSFSRHMKSVDAFEANPTDPAGKPYKITDADGTKHADSLKDLLTSQPWDYVTIQQASIDSPHIETFQPSADRLVQYVRKYAPQAKLLIHETWAYRFDHTSFKPGLFTQDDMYGALHANYCDLAIRERAVGIIPVGTALQNVRQDPRWKPVIRTDWDLSTYKSPALPPADYDLNVNYRWDTMVTPAKLVPDRGHCTVYGQFLGACVWYDFFFGDVRNNSYKPAKMSADDASLMREIAHRTVRERLTPEVMPSPTAVPSTRPAAAGR